MAEGYTAGILVLAACILYATGWWGKSPVPGRAAVWILVLSALAGLLWPAVRLSEQVSVNAGVVPVAGTAVVLLVRRGSPLDLWSKGACLMLIMALWLWLQRMETAHPELVLLHEGWTAPAACGLAASLLIARFADQAAALTVAAVLCGSLEGLTGAEWGLESGAVGGAAWWDGLSLSLAAAAVVKILSDLRRAGAAGRGTNAAGAEEPAADSTGASAD